MSSSPYLNSPQPRTEIKPVVQHPVPPERMDTDDLPWDLQVTSRTFMEFTPCLEVDGFVNERHPCSALVVGDSSD